MTRLLIVLAALGALLAGCASSGTSFTGTTWEWTASTTKTPASQSVVPDPQDYTIVFNTNQTFAAKADCNQVSGTWTSTSDNGLSITLGPSTLAECGADSLSSAYIAGLGQAKLYVIEESKLILTLTDDGTMTFQ
jgi:heat shock protein HslJ